MEQLYLKIIDYQKGNADVGLFFIQKFTPLLKHYAYLLNQEDGLDELQYQLLLVLKTKDFSQLRSHSDGAIVVYIKSTIYNQFIALSRKKHSLEKISYTEDLNGYDSALYERCSSSSDTYSALLSYDLQRILSPYENSVIYYHFVLNYNISEIAHHFKKSRQAVNQAKNSALRKLRKAYK